MELEGSGAMGLPLEVAARMPILVEIDDLVCTAGKRDGKMEIRGSKEGLKSFGEKMRANFENVTDVGDEDWVVAGVPLVLDERIMTKRLSFYMGEVIYAILDPEAGTAVRFAGNPMVMQDSRALNA